MILSTFFTISIYSNRLTLSSPPSRNVRPAQKWRERREEERYAHEQWRPRKRLSWYQIDHLKTLHQELPRENSIKQLADKFGISYQAVRRILKSKFEPSPEVQDRQDWQAMKQRKERQSKWKNRERKK